ncbi:GerAB/ArcD/ProY family transporter [Paenibacillus sp. JX-17]|uniref:GerAB/ArcD/ProY family transporter n=1 Tax=Paenibacillus lacisoli TaxID=3064525 RepID=A0ABT9CC31_9BACL|nr:GerAB/ArcD/ProY family transporter [Paenibacillus sp. JX-17]MDO7906430.1 GerAB/ArcD/ProY family transporter [Paenibacillus sp. JX-17]
MDKIKLSSLEMLALIMMLVLGTSLVISQADASRQDAWIANLLGIIPGVLIFLMYGFLHSRFPGYTLLGYAKLLLGSYLGKALGFLYLLFFLYGASRDLRDNGALIAMKALTRTPIGVVNMIMILTVAYVLYLGIEVLGRTAMLFLVLIIILGAVSLGLLTFSGVIHLSFIQPILGQGWKPVLQAVYQEVWMFPFGETICFVMLLPYLTGKAAGTGIGITAVVLAGLMLVVTVFITITVIGPDLRMRSDFPLQTVISLIRIQNFIERLDVVFIMTAVIGMCFKISIYYQAALLAASELFHIPVKRLILPFAFILLIASLTIAGSFQEHHEEGKAVLVTIFPVFSVCIPLLLVVVALVKPRKKELKRDEQG